MQWLQRVGEATKKLSYSGTFVYRNGRQSETSRITHWAGNGRPAERIEVLDGSPREVIRLGDEVRCYLPESRLVIVEQRSTRRMFPALLPASLSGLGEYYAIRKEGEGRIARLDGQIVRLEPRDSWRYGHQFWVDRQSGLLLRADTHDADGEMLESLAFTELKVGISPDGVNLKPGDGMEGKSSWKVRQARLQDLREDRRWLFRAEVPGFRRQAALRRYLPLQDGTGSEVLHWIFSDGLAAISVFISPLSGQPDRETETDEAGPIPASMGAISMVRGVVAGHRVVVMGDVPPATVKYFLDGIGLREK